MNYKSNKPKKWATKVQLSFLTSVEIDAAVHCYFYYLQEKDPKLSVTKFINMVINDYIDRNDPQFKNDEYLQNFVYQQTMNIVNLKGMKGSLPTSQNLANTTPVATQTPVPQQYTAPQVAQQPQVQPNQQVQQGRPVEYVATASDVNDGFEY